MKTGHPALPPTASRPWLWSAGAAVLAAHLGSWPGWGPIAASALVLGLVATGRLGRGVIVAAVALSAAFSTAPMPAFPSGPVELTGVLAGQVVEGRYGPYSLVDDGAGPVLVDLPEGSRGERGQVVLVEGNARGGPGEVSGEPHRRVIDVSRFEVVAEPDSPVLLVGNALRRRVLDRLVPLDGGRALLAGFLIGDTSGIDQMDRWAMRRAGLSHYTAVSGSNVAIFLGVLLVAAGPLGIGPRRRAVVGLSGLPVFAAVTGFEPSVMRASVMAALVLAGRLVGIGLEAWQVLSAATIGLLVADPGLAADVGFQLSVAATAGVVVGSRYPVPRGWMARSLAVGIGAQVAVAPLLILNFGQVPLLSPLANLAAAPVVAVATVIGIIGVFGLGPATDVAAWLASLVLAMARVASAWPQIGWAGLAVALVLLAVVMRRRSARPALALVASVVVAWLVVAPVRHLPEPGAVVLDVGQGDSILLSGGDHHFALVDGGPDQATLAENLLEYRAHALDLVVLTHDHADHSAGLAGLPGRVPVGLFWSGDEETGADDLTGRFEKEGTVVARPRIGDTYRLGALTLTVIGPVRGYESVNDESIVLMVEGPAGSMLLAGDIEAHAQDDLGGIEADVLKVPHHGGGTSDREWLEGVGADLAVISVGANDFGHPVPWVIDALESTGSEVVRTDLNGDVLVPLG